MSTEEIEKEFTDASELMRRCGRDCAPRLQEAAERMIDCFDRGNKVLLCGNGGSASQALHFAAELVNKLAVYRRALPAVALPADPAALTSIGNDLSFNQIFSRQVEALGRPGDVLWALSTSGRSQNIIEACEAAGRAGLFTVCCTGAHDSPLGCMAEICLPVPSDCTARIQEVHLCFGHSVCRLIERHYAQAC